MAKTNRVKELREAHGMSYEMLAARIPGTAGRPSIDSRTVRRWEEGSVPEKYWAPLAQIFQVSVTHLLGLDDDGTDGGSRKAA